MLTKRLAVSASENAWPLSFLSATESLARSGEAIGKGRATCREESGIVVAALSPEVNPSSWKPTPHI